MTTFLARDKTKIQRATSKVDKYFFHPKLKIHYYSLEHFNFLSRDIINVLNLTIIKHAVLFLTIY